MAVLIFSLGISARLNSICFSFLPRYFLSSKSLFKADVMTLCGARKVRDIVSNDDECAAIICHEISHGMYMYRYI